MKAYQNSRVYQLHFTEDGENVMQAEIEKNYYRIKEEVLLIVDLELMKLKAVRSLRI